MAALLDVGACANVSARAKESRNEVAEPEKVSRIWKRVVQFIPIPYTPVEMGIAFIGAQAGGGVAAIYGPKFLASVAAGKISEGLESCYVPRFIASKAAWGMVYCGIGASTSIASPAVIAAGGTIGVAGSLLGARVVRLICSTILARISSVASRVWLWWIPQKT